MASQGCAEHLTGNRFIDLAHADLLDRIGDLRECCVEGGGRDAVVPRFDAVAGAVRCHFQHEETIIRGAGFGGWEAHAHEHAVIGTQIGRLVDYVRECAVSTDFLCTVAGTLDLMLSRHETRHDREYADLLRQAAAVPAAGDLVAWTPAFETGVESVDDQHRDLAALLNRMHRLADAPHTAADALALLDTLHDHAQAHFAMEEGVVRTRAPGGFHQHRQHHAALLAQLGDVRDRVAEGRLALSVAVRDFLRFWLTGHIVGCDRPLLRGGAAEEPA